MPGVWSVAISVRTTILTSYKNIRARPPGPYIRNFLLFTLGKKLDYNVEFVFRIRRALVIFPILLIVN